MAWRTAWRPPRSSCSATGICSGRSAASMALRCDGRRRARRDAHPGTGAPRRQPGRRPPGRRGPRRRRGARRSSAIRPRARRPSSGDRRRRPCARRRRRRRPLPEPGARMTETSGARLGVPLTSMRPSVFSGDRAGFVAVSDRISMPSSPTSTSARNTAPTASPGGTRDASTVPLGWRAPAARQVHDPSPVWLVNSMSIRRDMRRTRYLAEAAGPVPGPGRSSRNMGADVRRSAGAARDGEPPPRAVRTDPCPFRRIHMSEDTEQPGPEPAAGGPKRPSRLSGPRSVRPRGPGSAGEPVGNGERPDACRRAARLVVLPPPPPRGPPGWARARDRPPR